MSTARVVHCKREPHDIYIGRPSKWGNPFKIGESPLAAASNLHAAELEGRHEIQFDGPLTREKAIECYRAWVLGRRELREALPELRGKVLGCWCAPKPCHGDVLVELANSEARP